LDVNEQEATAMAQRFFPGYPVHRLDWGFTIAHFIFWALLIAAIVWLVVWLVRTPHLHGALHEHHAPPRAPDTALQEARLRYARGEMSREDFLQISTDLGGAPTIPPPAPPAEG
jgi:uncharacterized membrane protein